MGPQYDVNIHNGHLHETKITISEFEELKDKVRNNQYKKFQTLLQTYYPNGNGHRNNGNNGLQKRLETPVPPHEFLLKALK
tara:strand:- start:77 stop:319 length:243 start_codon:yes stop_codon:yes gene_type:complete